MMKTLPQIPKRPRALKKKSKQYTPTIRLVTLCVNGAHKSTFLSGFFSYSMLPLTLLRIDSSSSYKYIWYPKQTLDRFTFYLATIIIIREKEEEEEKERGGRLYVEGGMFIYSDE
jgi:hypothetical protein